MEDKYPKIKKVLWQVLLVNFLVALLKVIYGLFTNCASMLADGLHSFSDGTSNIIGLLGILAASKPKDIAHPYGHKKYETFATIGIAALLFIVSFNIIKQAVHRILVRHVIPEVNLGSFIIMLLTLFANILIMRYEYGQGKRLPSDILISDSMHTKSDIFSTLAVIGTLISIKLGFPIIDTVVASCIAVLIAYTGYRVIKTSSDILCDTIAVSYLKIEEIVESIPGVRACHRVRTRGRQDDIYVDLHIIVDTKMHVGTAHDLSHKIETTLKKRISGISDVIVHIEPLRSETEL